MGSALSSLMLRVSVSVPVLSKLNPRSRQAAGQVSRAARTHIGRSSRSGMPLSAQIKLSSVIQAIIGASGRDMLGALIAGQRSAHALADLARGKMRAKVSLLQDALT